MGFIIASWVDVKGNAKGQKLDKIETETQPYLRKIILTPAKTVFEEIYLCLDDAIADSAF